MSNNVARGPVAYICCEMAMALGAGNHSQSCRNYRRCEHTEQTERTVIKESPIEIVTYTEERCTRVTDIGESLCPRHKLLDAMQKLTCTAAPPAAPKSEDATAVEAARNPEKEGLR